MEPFTLTKEEFITRAMAGEVFIDKRLSRFYYDNTQTIPFRVESSPMETAWGKFDNTHLFILEQPKTIIERRWKWRKDNPDYTEETDCYHNDINALPLHAIGWYKAEDCFIDVKIKA